MKRKIFIVIMILSLAIPAMGAIKQTDEVKRMGIFISNFTELGMYQFDLEADGDYEVLHLGDPDAMNELIHFGIGHNVINNKKLITKCPRKNCEYGPSLISAKNVAASVKKYFDLEVEHESIEGDAPEVYYDGKNYHFNAANYRNEPIYYAEVQDVKRGKKVITMTGELYNIKDKSDRPGRFTAKAKPYKWDKKDTWAILSLEVVWY